MAVKIVEGLYLGSKHVAHDAEGLRELGVGHVINCTKEVASMFKGELQYLEMGLDDSMEDDIGKWFEGCKVFIDAALGGGGKVLVHCQAGISRSATIVIAYLMLTRGMTLKEAFFHVKSRKPNVQPNVHFFETLQDLDARLTGSSTFSAAEYYLSVLEDMGFERDKAQSALERSQYDFDLAVTVCLGGI